MTRITLTLPANTPAPVVGADVKLGGTRVGAVVAVETRTDGSILVSAVVGPEAADCFRDAGWS